MRGRGEGPTDLPLVGALGDAVGGGGGQARLRGGQRRRTVADNYVVCFSFYF